MIIVGNVGTKEEADEILSIAHIFAVGMRSQELSKQTKQEVK